MKAPATKGVAGRPVTLGLMQKRVDGDDALLALAKHRFEQAGMGAELYAGSPQELGWLLQFVPEVGQPTVVHLPRGLDLMTEDARRQVLAFAERGSGRVHALVVHDQVEAASALDAYVAALQQLEEQLAAKRELPLVCVEYAAGLEPPSFKAIFERTLGLAHIAPCVDIGHVGLAQARRGYAAMHAGVDVCALHPGSPGLKKVIGDVQVAVAQGRDAACALVGELAAMGKPLHMHLHDAHPLSKVSPWGVSDHLTFLEPIALPFEHEGRWSVDSMFGPGGLRRIVALACRAGPSRLSLSLEIHPTEGRRPLGEASRLFAHWSDHTNAERMDYWLNVLIQNHQLLRSACEAGFASPGAGA